VAVVTDESPDFISLSCTHVHNAPGQCKFEINGSSPIVQLFEVDGQIEVRRRAPEFGITDWYTEWDGFHITEQRVTQSDGTKRYTSFGAEYLDLVGREEIGYYAGTKFTDKLGFGESVIKDYVFENIGPGADDPHRIDNGIRAGLTIQPDMSNGDYWEGSKSWVPLLSTIQEIAAATRVAFDIVRVGQVSFEFRVYPIQRGLDRSKTNVNGLTGLNGSGNPPVLFSTAIGNMVNPSVVTTRGDSKNVIYVLGQGTDQDRNVLVVSDPNDVKVSPWGRRVLSSGALQESTNKALQSLGEGTIKERRSQTAVTFEPLQTAGNVYGKHYFFGDTITIEYDELLVSVEIVELQISVSSSVESLRFAFR
jgi:hypothetical protein